MTLIDAIALQVINLLITIVGVQLVHLYIYIYMTDPLLQSQGIQLYCQRMIKECPSSPPKRIVIWSHETGCFNWMIVTFLYMFHLFVDSLW